MRGNFVLQDIVLNQIRRDKSFATFCTVTGEVFIGKLRGFDYDTVIVDLSEGRQCMLYKKNLVWIEPALPVLIDKEENA